jgi:uncharacterized membrane protein YjgN (DUF898 family)
VGNISWSADVAIAVVFEVVVAAAVLVVVPTIAVAAPAAALAAAQARWGRAEQANMADTKVVVVAASFQRRFMLRIFASPLCCCFLRRDVSSDCLAVTTRQQGFCLEDDENKYETGTRIGGTNRVVDGGIVPSWLGSRALSTATT